MEDSVDLYQLRKRPRVSKVHGISVKNGKTVKAQIPGAIYYADEKWSKPCLKSLCNICNLTVCDHTVLNTWGYRYTPDSRFQRKNVRKCNCCVTHVCENMIPKRGRKIHLEVEVE